MAGSMHLLALRLVKILQKVYTSQLLTNSKQFKQLIKYWNPILMVPISGLTRTQIIAMGRGYKNPFSTVIYSLILYL